VGQLKFAVDDALTEVCSTSGESLAGVDGVMVASALLARGPEYATALLDGLAMWMARKGFHTVGELRGMLSVPPAVDHAEYERAGYVTALRAASRGSYGPW
jgi:dihydroorotate dehydrogenase (fumarate)